MRIIIELIVSSFHQKNCLYFLMIVLRQPNLGRTSSSDTMYAPFSQRRFLFIYLKQFRGLWVTFLAETSKDLEIILITSTIVLSFTNSLSSTSLYLSLFSLAKTVTNCNSFSQTEEV